MHCLWRSAVRKRALRVAIYICVWYCVCSCLISCPSSQHSTDLYYYPIHPPLLHTSGVNARLSNRLELAAIAPDIRAPKKGAVAADRRTGNFAARIKMEVVAAPPVAPVAATIVVGGRAQAALAARGAPTLPGHGPFQATHLHQRQLAMRCEEGRSAPLSTRF